MSVTKTYHPSMPGMVPGARPKITGTAGSLLAMLAMCSSALAQEAASGAAAPQAEAAVELPEVVVETTAPAQRKYPKPKAVKTSVVKVAPTNPNQNSASQSAAAGGGGSAVEVVAAVPADGQSASQGGPAISQVGDIVGNRQGLVDLGGSGAVLDGEELYTSHVMTTNEALRKVPGIHVRDEEGLGIRPNIGIRGLNPTRSTKTLLLEDGLFLSYAPYGDNASYFHPTNDRFDHIEVMKGADQILYGPQTISGTINYVTPNPPDKPGGFVAGTAGSRDYFNGQVFAGGWAGNVGATIDYVRKQGQGARDNMDHEIDDFAVKSIVQVSPEAAIIAKANYFREDSQVTYSGLTDAEFRNYGPRYNPFGNDEFDTERYATSLTLNWDLNSEVNSKTSLYWSWFNRDWWRQSSTTTEAMCGPANSTFRRSDRADGIEINPDGCNQRQGRLRDYYTHGIEQRWTYQSQLTELVRNEFKFGWRIHREEQDRLQINTFANNIKPGLGDITGTGGTATAGNPISLSEQNERETKAFSLFASNRIEFGAISITPMVRFEDIENERTNYLRATSANPAQNCTDPPCEGAAEYSETIPGITVGYEPTRRLKFFAGVHEGFAPPRVEDGIGQGGGSVEVEPEKSINFEAGMKSEPMDGLRFDATYFRNDFENLVAVGSIAGGNVPLAQGEALFEGLEIGLRADSAKLLKTPLNFYTQVAWTWLWTAEQSSDYVRVDNGLPIIANLDTTGNRQPYAPEHMVTARLGYSQRNLDMHIEMVYVGEQFADFQNFASPEAACGLVGITDGRDNCLYGLYGEIDAYTIFNLGMTYTYEPTGTDFFFSVKNLFDETYITDRTRGIQVGAPQLVHFGMKQTF